MNDDVIVLKFGGTSLASPRRVRRAAARVRAHLRRGRRVVVVVSAAGHETDRLLARIRAVTGWELHPAPPESPAPPAPGDRDGRRDARREVRREIDRVLATGEDRSAGLLALALRALGIPARSLRGGEAGITATGEFGAGSIERVEPAPLRRLLDCGIVPVISGFQGERHDGETLTLGRGGSDLSAIALAAALGPAPCHIVTDVDAVYDSDPRANPAARAFTTMEHAELVALTEAGAAVVHPRAARLAETFRVPLRVYGYHAPRGGGGTRIGLTTSVGGEAQWHAHAAATLHGARTTELARGTSAVQEYSGARELEEAG
jgi:aspartate kinase